MRRASVLLAAVILAVVVRFASASGAETPLRLVLPLACDPGRTCVVQNYVDHDPSPAARDYACGPATYDGHDGTDFRLPTTAAMQAGVAVMAAAPGRVARVRDGMADVSIRVEDADVDGRECGNGVVVVHRDGWETQYCHLARGSIAVKPGDEVAAGHPLGRVGLSGKTEFPHLHLTVRRRGGVVDPFADGATAGVCGSGTSLFEPAVAAALAYRAGQVLNVGFAAGPVTMETVEAGEAGRISPGRDAPALVVFVRAIGLRAGDVQRITLRDPAGTVLVDRAAEPLDRDKAQVLFFAGRKRLDTEWPAGTFRAVYTVLRAGAVALEERLELRF